VIMNCEHKIEEWGTVNVRVSLEERLVRHSLSRAFGTLVTDTLGSHSSDQTVTIKSHISPNTAYYNLLLLP
jgi:hypothetical protein